MEYPCSNRVYSLEKGGWPLAADNVPNRLSVVNREDRDLFVFEQAKRTV